MYVLQVHQLGNSECHDPLNGNLHSDILSVPGACRNAFIEQHCLQFLCIRWIYCLGYKPLISSASDKFGTLQTKHKFNNFQLVILNEIPRFNGGKEH